MTNEPIFCIENDNLSFICAAVDAETLIKRFVKFTGKDEKTDLVCTLKRWLNRSEVGDSVRISGYTVAIVEK